MQPYRSYAGRTQGWRVPGFRRESERENVEINAEHLSSIVRRKL